MLRASMADDRTRTHDLGPTSSPSSPDGALRLIVIDAERSRVIDLAPGDSIVGRAEQADVRLDDASVSKQHARLRVRPDGAVSVADLGSRNGTRLDGRPLTEESALEPGEPLEIGRSTLVLQRGDGVLRRPPRAASTFVDVRRVPLGEDTLVIADDATARAYALLGRLAASTLTVCVLGETGTGKELAARFLHERSPRAAGRFVSLNCAAVAESLAEAELFGHARGAFTGAAAARAGVIEAAHGGTLFLDEIGELTPPIQAKLLRALETRTVVRVGEVEPRRVDVRLVCATHRDLDQEVREGRFRQDLRFRIAGAPVHLAPLRERPRELRALAAHFLGRAAGARPLTLSEEATTALQRHPWPGNVRELRNAMEWVAATCEGLEVGVDDLPESLREARVSAGSPSPPDGAFRGLADEVKDLERRRIAEALAATGGNKTRAAAMLAMPIRTLSEKVKQYGLGK